MQSPLFVLASSAEATRLTERLATQGWRTQRGFTLPEEPWDLTHARVLTIGHVPDEATAAAAVLAAARGAGVVAVAHTPGLTSHLLADLARVGPVRQDPAAAIDNDNGADGPLNDEQKALLEHLAAGESIAAAAEAEFLSLRTANRRLSQARQALGVRTTREAVVEYVRLRNQKQ